MGGLAATLARHSAADSERHRGPRIGNVLGKSQRAVEPPVLLPREDFFVAEVRLGLRNCPAADACEDKLVEEFIGG